MSTSTVTSKGQITLPKEVRKHLRLAEGDRVEFAIEADGQVRLKTVSGSVRDLFGCVPRRGGPVPTLQELREELVEGLAADVPIASTARRSRT